ncbi:MAG: hypothetical protein M2R45_01956 [Verrucomicrobia subdivision 3 bacterium]|nr:hypothetical protein [Limisphaerales bacterium]MCS1416177.1 hypothetical protein [Limisphaerales bacterium]
MQDHEQGIAVFKLAGALSPSPLDAGPFVGKVKFFRQGVG